MEDLVTHLHTSDTRYRAALPAEFLNRNPPPIYTTLYFIVTRLPDSLRAVRDHFLALDPTVLPVDLLEQHLLAAQTSVVAVGAARGNPRMPFFEGCSTSPLAPSYTSAAAVDVLGAEDVKVASASGKRRSSKGKGGRGGGGRSGGGGGGSICLQLHERFRQDLSILRLHSDSGGEFSSDLLWHFCRGEGILQSFMLPASPQQNGITERRIGLVMEVAHTSMIHAAAPHFLWLFAYIGHGASVWFRGPFVLTGHADASWVDDSATLRSSQGYPFSLGSGSVSWRSTCSSLVLCSSCEAEISAGAMPAQELRRLTYLLTDLGEKPRSPPVL
ncbi:unnamed protein product [Closterium sp. NIES-54]